MLVGREKTAKLFFDRLFDACNAAVDGGLPDGLGHAGVGGHIEGGRHDVVGRELLVGDEIGNALATRLTIIVIALSMPSSWLH